ncbi:AAA family ATPase [Pectobacterium punjabense]|uniref:AAA family ATPase n=1 Tax=Pectobacterium punjabense TaxID=2108399 RepID=UPI00311EB118
MIRLERIFINGFKQANSTLNLMFSASNTSVIYGENGCGKTTLLKILHAIFEKDESILKINEVVSIDIYYSHESYYDRVIIKKKYESTRRWISGSDEHYDWGSYDSSPLAKTSSLLLGVERGVITQATRIDPRLVFDFFRTRNLFINKEREMFNIANEMAAYLKAHSARYVARSEPNRLDFHKKNLNLQSIKMENIEGLIAEKYRLARITATKRIQSALFDTLSLAINLNENKDGPIQHVNIPNDFGRLLIENKDRIIEALDDGEENKFKNTVIEILSSENLINEVEKYKQHPILSQLFINMINELKLEKQMLSSINLLIDTFNGFLINGKELVVNENNVVVKVGAVTHGINLLSSGERHILTFLSIILFEGRDRNFLIIDEPEISLNIKWQRELMPLLSELLPTTQIIVASHSPSLANKNPHYLRELELKLG